MSQPTVRRVLHCDMDCFYAAVHMRDDPSLRGKPVAVGGSPEGRGVVAAASYEIRRFGVRSAMPAAQARRLCPHAIFLRPDFRRYREESRRIFRILREYSDMVQPVSIDEAFLDCSRSYAHYGSATAIAQEIRRRVRRERDLAVSIGVAPNRLVAKIASDLGKPDGLFVVRPTQVEELLEPLPVRVLPGVGPVTQRRLEARGLVRVGQLRGLSVEELRELVGSYGKTLYCYCRGIDERPVRVQRERKSLSSERTYSADLHDLAAMDEQLETLSRQVADGLEKRSMAAATVTIKVRFENFTTVTRSQSRGLPYVGKGAIAEQAKRLLRKTEAGARSVRLLGVGASNLMHGAAEQLRLFDDQLGSS